MYRSSFHHLSRVTAATALLLGALPALAVPTVARMDASLALAAGQPPASATRFLPQSIIKKSATRAESTVAATIRFTGDPLPELKKLGVRIGSVSGNIVTADIPLSKINAVSTVPGVVFVEAAKVLQSRLSVSVPATGATSLRTGNPLQWAGATGEGVIVGVVDDGLDFRHQDFRKADGTTRLLSLWDMRAAAQGTPPTGFDYGNECTPAKLNQAITEGPSSTACAQPSTGNHGTHVGGIAAGNGQATGNSQAAFRHIGMAPMADIISANGIGGGVTTSNGVIDGINYIKAKAQAAGKPAVINLSLGSYYGSRDGTSNYETAISAATGPGLIITAAAGNEGDAPIRAEAPITQGGSAAISYSIPKGEQKVEIWYPGTHQWSVQVSKGDCTTTVVPADTPSYTVDTACGKVDVSNNAVNPLNDDRQILITIGANAAGTDPAGVWQVRVDAIKGSGTVSMIGGEVSTGGTFTSFTTPVTTQILTDACTATAAICVGAYVTRQEWTTTGGAPSSNTGHGPIGSVATFSSRGPRRDCSNTAKCPATAKPEILAPGAMIMAALGQDHKVADNSKTDVDTDGVHIALNGTSMATPHVSGAVALLLQKKPTLTPAEVRKLLYGNLQLNGLAPATLPVYDPAVAKPANADVAWGYGIMDIARAYTALTSASGGTPGSIEPQVTGSATNLTMGALITPKASEIGQTLQTFVVAALPTGALFVNNQGNWQPLTNPPGYFSQGVANGPITVSVFKNLNHAGAGLGGTLFFIGYGTDVTQMITEQKFKLVHTLAN